MKYSKVLIMFWIFVTVAAAAAETVRLEYTGSPLMPTFRLTNSRVVLSISFQNGQLLSEVFETTPANTACPISTPTRLESDGDFRLQVVWTDWRAPGKMNNGDNPVILCKSDFSFREYQLKEESGGAKELDLFLKGVNQNLELKITYRLEPGKFYGRRKLALRDSEAGAHFLEKIAVVAGNMRLVLFAAARETATARIEGARETVALEAALSETQVGEKLMLIKNGGFGQPVVLTFGSAGAFWGLEYPAARNEVMVKSRNSAEIACWQDCGRKIEKEWLESDWLVTAVTPDNLVKKWFFAYLDDIRVAPLRPYALYNSWYDLRSAEYPGIPTANVMNEANVRRMIDLVRQNMIEKHGIKLDAFVLDDGWDVYESDWVLRPAQFPNGLRPIAAELAKTGTTLGLWFGPGGGYSFRMKRIDWMKAHGYEVVGQGKNRAMLCLGGVNYRALFKKRVSDFVAETGVGYFKWDGVQFSCSEPDHGHPVGIFSRTAILDALIEQCRTVRQKNPVVFLNVTSGTWLSPWWLKYADTIWMDGADYAFAGVPSPTDRDSAMTYRDYVLYDDFYQKGLWFPIANLMTHGIIKGKLESISGGEPLAKFSDDVLLYFGRGVSMYELYISPDILNVGEWKVISQGLNWARDRFPVLRHSEMIGGNPGRGATYGFVHFAGKKGIIAARNPVTDSSCLELSMDTAYGLDANASSLVLEQVYPVRRVWPELYASGARMRIPLAGFETAIYEVYPLAEAPGPLLAGVITETSRNNGRELTWRCFDPTSDIRLLNPEKVLGMTANGQAVTLSELGKAVPQAPPALTSGSFALKKSKRRQQVELAFNVDQTVGSAVLAILLRQGAGSQEKTFPELDILLDGRKAIAAVHKQDGAYAWFSIALTPGQHAATITCRPAANGRRWSGSLAAWVNVCQLLPAVAINLRLNTPIVERIMPPRSWADGTVRRSLKLGEERIDLEPAK